MKAGKEGPMKKNFPSVFKQQTVELADGQTQMKATTEGITVKGPGGKKVKYAVDAPGYAGAKQAFIDAGGQSPYLLGSSTGMSGAQGRKRDVKPMGVDIDGQMVQSGPARRNYGPMTMKKSAMKAAKPDFPDIDGDGNTTESMKKAAADKKSAKKMKKAPMKLKKAPAKMKKAPMNMKKSAMKLKKSPAKLKAKAGAKKDAMMDRKSAMTMKKESGMKMKKKAAMKMKKESSMKMGHKKK